MSKQRKLHERATKKLGEMEVIIDQMKAAGPDDLDGWSALKNTAGRLQGLAVRARGC